MTRRPASGSAWLSRWVLASGDRKSTRLNSSHLGISYAVFCLKKKRPLKLTAVSSWLHHSRSSPLFTFAEHPAGPAPPRRRRADVGTLYTACFAFFFF